MKILDRIMFIFWILVFIALSIYCGIKHYWESFAICIIFLTCWTPMAYYYIIKK